MLSRLPNWPSRLSDYILRSANTTFKYGSFDCGLFCADAIEAITGVDVAAELRGVYTSRRVAFHAIKALCGKATMERMAEWVADKYCMAQVPVLQAKRGDLVLISRGARSSVGIVAMNGYEILTPAKGGLVRVPISNGAAAWHIG